MLQTTGGSLGGEGEPWRGSPSWRLLLLQPAPRGWRWRCRSKIHGASLQPRRPAHGRWHDQTGRASSGSCNARGKSHWRLGSRRASAMRAAASKRRCQPRPEQSPRRGAHTRGQRDSPAFWEARSRVDGVEGVGDGLDEAGCGTGCAARDAPSGHVGRTISRRICGSVELG